MPFTGSWSGPRCPTAPSGIWIPARAASTPSPPRAATGTRWRSRPTRVSLPSCPCRTPAPPRWMPTPLPIISPESDLSMKRPVHPLLLWLLLPLALVLRAAPVALPIHSYTNPVPVGTATNFFSHNYPAISNAIVANGISGLLVDGARPTLYVTNVAAMRALTGLASGQLVQTAGRTTPGYGGATFLWTAGLTTTTILGTVFDFDTGGTGRFTLAHGDPGDIRLWGAIPGSGDDASAIQAAIDSLTATTFGGAAKPQLFIPSGQWHVGSSINVTNPIAIRGEGIELNSVNVSAYSLNGSVLVSTITGGDPVIHVVGRDSGGNTYIQGVEFKDFGIDGSTTDGAGIWWDCNSNLSDCYTSRI